MSYSSLTDREGEGVTVNGDGPVPMEAETEQRKKCAPSVLDGSNFSLGVGRGGHSDERKGGGEMESCNASSGVSAAMFSQDLPTAISAPGDRMLSASKRPTAMSFQSKIAGSDTALVASRLSQPSTTAMSFRQAQAADGATALETINDSAGQLLNTDNALESDGGASPDVFAVSDTKAANHCNSSPSDSRTTRDARSLEFWEEENAMTTRTSAQNSKSGPSHMELFSFVKSLADTSIAFDANAASQRAVTSLSDTKGAMFPIQKEADKSTTNKFPLDSSGNKYASLFAPRAGQWDSWQRHVETTATNQQNALVAAAKQAALTASSDRETEQAQQQTLKAAAHITKQQATATSVKQRQEAPAKNVTKAASTKQQQNMLVPGNAKAAEGLGLEDAAFALALTMQKDGESSSQENTDTVGRQSAVTASAKHMKGIIQSRARSDMRGHAKHYLPSPDSTKLILAKGQVNSNQPASPSLETARFESSRCSGSGADQEKFPSRQQHEDRRDSSTHSAKRRKPLLSKTGVVPRAVSLFPPPAGAAKPPQKNPEQSASFTDTAHHNHMQPDPGAQVGNPSAALQQIRPPKPLPRNADKPMTYLVRQLLGQIPADPNDPAFVLSPHLVKKASSKIQLVIAKLVEAAVKRTKEKGKNGASRAKSSRIEEMQRELRILNQFAQDRANQVVEQDSVIAQLRRKLDDNLVVINQKRNQLEERRSRALQGGETVPTIPVSSIGDDAAHDETVRTLVQKLHRVIATVQKVKKEIEAYRRLAKQDEIELQQKEDVIKLLRAMIETECAVSKQRAASKKAGPSVAVRPPVPPTTEKQRQIAVLKKAIDSLKDTLQEQRATSERRMKAFMGASTQALKEQTAFTSSRKRKSRNA